MGVSICQNATLLEIVCHGSIMISGPTEGIERREGENYDMKNIVVIEVVIAIETGEEIGIVGEIGTKVETKVADMTAGKRVAGMITEKRVADTATEKEEVDTRVGKRVADMTATTRVADTTAGKRADMIAGTKVADMIAMKRVADMTVGMM